jgi:hypothetical protein
MLFIEPRCATIFRRTTSLPRRVGAARFMTLQRSAFTSSTVQRFITAKACCYNVRILQCALGVRLYYSPRRVNSLRGQPSLFAPPLKDLSMVCFSCLLHMFAHEFFL